MTNALKNLMAKVQKGNRPAFKLSPFLSLTYLKEKRLQFNEIFQNPESMAAAAWMNFELGFESTVLPFDLNVEAEILGAEVRYHEGFDGQPVYPTIAQKPVLANSGFSIPDDPAHQGRMPVVLQALRTVKEKASSRGAVGAFITGPFTMAGQVADIDDLFKLVLKKPDRARELFRQLAILINRLKDLYTSAGADFIVVEDGGATGISPKAFREILLPCLRDVFAVKKVPQVLSLAGNSEPFIKLVLECNPDGIGIDQKCDIEKAREIIPESVPLFAVCGAQDMMAVADPVTVMDTVQTCLSKGATTVAPPADIYPPAKIENIWAFIEAVQEFEG